MRLLSLEIASRREFDATKDFGKLLGLTLQLLDGPVRRLHQIAVAPLPFRLQNLG